MVVVPVPTPVTSPVDELMVATLVLDDPQVPPAVTSLKLVVAPGHTTRVPVIGDACSQIVTGLAVFHKSPPSAARLWFTALTTPYNTTLPVPATGACHDILST